MGRACPRSRHWAHHRATVPGALTASGPSSQAYQLTQRSRARSAPRSRASLRPDRPSLLSPTPGTPPMTQSKTSAVTPTRAEDYAGWYQAVVRAADLAEPAPVRGCMTIKPWGYGIWERIQSILDRRFKETGHRNCYFPLFIPLQY